MTTDELMSRAVKEAFSGIRKGHGGPFGAVIAKDGDIVSKGHNTVVRDDDPTAHAEVNAIRAACRKLGTPHLDGCTVFTTSEPCPMCLAAAYWAQVDAIVFCAPRDLAARAGFTDGAIYEDLALPPGDRRIALRMDDRMSGKVEELFKVWQTENGMLY